uniref:Calcineurin-like phosphoesterase n=1 Tax=virus sp. ctoC338 TaxID=2827997 RepID=A0A8S5SWA5_9VIRU|nr:MAG TPA: Calcineurin-like phosphoesterase [virus sp. ctoC338]
MSYDSLIKTNIAPYAASKIGVYNSSGTRVGSIAIDNFKPTYGERLYRFGLLSDVHNETAQADGNQADIRNALNFFNQKEDIEFTVISGDLTQTSYSSGSLTTEMALYKANLEAINNSTPVYPTTGNHDCPTNSNIDINTFKSYAGISNLFTSDATYSYEVTKTHTTSDGTTVNDHFLFLGMRMYEFASLTYLNSDITWLGNKLESYKNDRCFVITHMFFPDASGNFQQIYPSGNWLSGSQLASLKTLRANYPRVIWFSGHSHWKWYLQQAEPYANVWPVSNVNRTTAWCVHVPSCAYPIDSSVCNSNLDSTRVSMAGQSEGAIVDVYKDYIDIRAIEFKGENDSDYVTRYLPIAQYRLYTAPETGGSSGGEDDRYIHLTSDMVSINTGKTTGATFSVDDATHDLTINFTTKPQGILISDGSIDTSSTVKIYFDSITFSDGSTSPTKIGFYTSGGKYEITSGTSTMDVSAAAIQFNTSSSYSGTTPITVTLTNVRFEVS